MNYQNGHTLPRQAKQTHGSPNDTPVAQGFESPWLKRGASSNPPCPANGESVTTRNLESQQSVNAAYSASASTRSFTAPSHPTTPLSGVGNADTGSAVLAASRPHYSSTLGRSSRPTASLSGPKYRSSSATSLAHTDLYGDTAGSQPDAYGSLRFVRQQSNPHHRQHQQHDQQASAQAQLIAKHQTELRLHKEDIADLEALSFAQTSDGLRHSSSSASSGSSNPICEKKESTLLRKTIVEMEMRISSQKETLANRDESIKRLLSIMQSQGSPYDSEQLDRIDLELSRSELAENKRQIKQLQASLEAKDEEMLSLRKTAEDSSQLIQIQEKLGKSEALLMASETQIVLLKTQIENYERQSSDDKHRIALVKEQLNSKESQVTLQIAELDKYKLRLQEKEDILSKKSSRIQESDSGLKRIEHELEELQINSQQIELANANKILTKDKELAMLKHQLNESEAKLKKLSDRDLQNSEVYKDNQRSLSEKDKILKKLQEETLNSENSSKEIIKELETKYYEMQKSEHKLQTLFDLSQSNVTSLTNDLNDLRKLSDSHQKQNLQFEIGRDQNKKDFDQLKILNEQLKDQLSERMSLCSDKSSEMNALQEKIANYVQEAKQQALVEQRLKAHITIMEKSKIEEIQKLTKQLEDLESEDHRRKVKHDADKKQESEDTVQLKRVVTQYTNRVEELEEALKNSVAITTQREMHMQGLQSTIEQQHKQTTTAHEELETLKSERDSREEQFIAMESILKERDDTVLSMKVERRLQLKELYEMKQEAVVAAISEKDAHIALLENTPNSNQKNIDNVAKLTAHKLQLQKQLSDVTQKRMNIHLLEDELEEKSRIPVLAKKSPRKNKKSKEIESN